MQPSARLEVDGQVFDVAARHDRPGQYDYAWISGQNPGYGFSSGRSDGGPSTMVDHEAAIRTFLSQLDPETGYIG
jgi:pimeloyl-ACP methyl ester carboxylesterase